MIRNAINVTILEISKGLNKMKKTALTMVAVLMLIGIAYAAIVPVARYIHKSSGDTMYVTQKLDLSADASAVNLSEDLVGGYLFSVEIFTSADDAVTFTIDSGIGTVLFTNTTVTATAGDIANPSGYWPINSLPNYTLAGLGAGTATVEITVVKR